MKKKVYAPMVHYNLTEGGSNPKICPYLKTPDLVVKNIGMNIWLL